MLVKLVQQDFEFLLDWYLSTLEHC